MTFLAISLFDYCLVFIKLSSAKNLEKSNFIWFGILNSMNYTVHIYNDFVGKTPDSRNSAVRQHALKINIYTLQDSIPLKKKKKLE